MLSPSPSPFPSPSPSLVASCARGFGCGFCSRCAARVAPYSDFCSASFLPCPYFATCSVFLSTSIWTILSDKPAYVHLTQFSILARRLWHGPVSKLLFVKSVAGCWCLCSALDALVLLQLQHPKHEGKSEVKAILENRFGFHGCRSVADLSWELNQVMECYLGTEPDLLLPMYCVHLSFNIESGSGHMQ